MKTYRVKIVDYDGSPAALELQADNPGQAVAKTLMRLRQFGLDEDKSIQVLGVQEVSSSDQGGCET